MEDWLKKLQGSILDQIPVQVVPGVVEDVNAGTAVCNVKPLQGPLMYDVRLAAVEGQAAGFVAVPKVGADVLVAIINNSVNDAAVLWASELESCTISVDTTVLKMDADGFEIKRGGESLTALITDLIGAIKALTVTTSQGPSGTPINLPALEAIENRLTNLLK